MIQYGYGCVVVQSNQEGVRLKFGLVTLQRIDGESKAGEVHHIADYLPQYLGGNTWVLVYISVYVVPLAIFGGMYCCFGFYILYLF